MSAEGNRAAGSKSIVLVDEAPLRRAMCEALLLQWFAPAQVPVDAMAVRDACLHLELDPRQHLIALSIGGASLEDADTRQRLRLLKSVAPETPLLVIGERDDPDEVQMAIKLFAQGYVPYALDPAFAMQCFEFVRNGGSYFPTSALSSVIRSIGVDDDPGGAAAGEPSGRAPDASRPGRAVSPFDPKRDISDVAAAEDAGARQRDAVRSEPMRRQAAAHISEKNGAETGVVTVEAERAPTRVRLDVRTHAEPEQTAALTRANGVARRLCEKASPPAAARAPDRPEPPRSEQSGAFEPGPTLTTRQSEVLDLLTDGCSNKVIARKLNMAEATVKVHVRQIMRKFGAKNRTQVVVNLYNRNPEAAQRLRS